jgi:hypothetical protein
MATGAGGRVEAAEGLYLSCRPRYSRQKMGVDVHSSWSISEKIMVEGDGDGCAQVCTYVASSACLCIHNLNCLFRK